MSAMLETIIGVVIVGMIIITVLQIQANFSTQHIIDNQSYSAQIDAYSLNRQLNQDISSIGYNLLDFASSIIDATADSIMFKTDLDDDAVADTVSIYTRNFAVDATTNPYDFEIIRDIGGTEFNYNTAGLTDFEFRFFDTTGAETAVLANIRLISYRFEVMGTEPAESGNDSLRFNYPISAGEERVFIKNLYNW
jgi:hypothetical protein